ncbi:secreted protein [Lojkania enalia]|uniref:Secreted protein n=1 Tax=Lojkania enalia TaxID=147567 RepID=A0A9P4N096_9PLEO|nr:secreted protein [Didymosphaeria enalia]
MSLFFKVIYFVLLFTNFAVSTTAAWKNLTLSNYKLKQTGYSSTIANLDKALPNVKLATIMENLNHDNPGTAPKVKNLLASSGYGWKDSSNFNDQDTEKWYPQGISTSADAFDSEKYEGYSVQLISWHSDHYDDGKRGARISFVKQGSGRKKKYRHVLLVRPKGDEDFEAIKGLHAGGIVWYGNLLYVVDTTSGLRVFDLNHIYSVDESIKNKAGKSRNKYARSYDWQKKSGVTNMRFSFISLDRTTTPDSLIIGEYHAERTNCRLLRFDADYKTRLLKTSSGIATASQAVQHGNTKIQGATSINGKFFLTQSGGSLITHTWKDRQKKTTGVFPKVPEDLSYEKDVGLWTLMEQPGYRHVFAIDSSKF